MSKQQKHIKPPYAHVKIGVDRLKAKPRPSSKSISEIMDIVHKRHQKSLDKLAE